MSIAVQTPSRTIALRTATQAKRVAALLTSRRSQAYLLRRLAVFANHDTRVLK